MSSIANKHLSKYGRYGDTEIVKTSDGNLWHVSKDEKRLIDAYGKYGEKLVDDVGSGTINPETGLEEKWAWLIPAAALAVSTISGAASGYAQEQSAGVSSDYAQAGLDKIQTSLTALGESTRASREALTASFGKKLSDFSETFGYKKGGTRESIRKAKGQTGFANVEMGDEELEMLNKTIESGMGDLQFSYGTEMGKLSARDKTERARLESDRLALQREKDLADERADSWYLGKNIINLFS
tara:strand:- start:13399 stop:14121 length:723 start_codon:yes stop_codon:yes gene_type:complete